MGGDDDGDDDVQINYMQDEAPVKEEREREREEGHTVGQRGRPNWSRVSWEVHVESVAAEAAPLLTGVVVSLLLLLE